MSEAKHLGDVLRELRERKGMSQSEVARYLGVSRQAVSMWEAGKNYPSPRRKNALYDLLGAKAAARTVAANSMKSEVRERFDAATDVPIFRTRPSELISGAFVFETPLVGWIPAPDSLPADKDVSCFLMPDTSMVPWRSAGEPVFMDQKRQPKIGDHALIRLGEPGKTAPKGAFLPEKIPTAFTVRLLTGLSADGVRLKTYLTGQEETIPLAEVGKMTRIIEWSELYGPLAKVWQSSSFD